MSGQDAATGSSAKGLQGEETKDCDPEYITRESWGLKLITLESLLYVQVWTQKFGRRTVRDIQVKIIFRITPC